MATAVAHRPDRGLEWIRSQSTPMSMTIAALGAAALASVVLGVIISIATHGLTPLESMIEALRSDLLKGFLWVAVVVGLAACLLSVFLYRTMPTHASRDQAISGGVLGIQALVLGAALLAFVRGDVEKFALNYLDFDLPLQQTEHFINGAKNTVFLAFTSEALGIVLGLVLALFAISKRPVVRAPARIYINFFRGTPLIWQITFIGVAIPLSSGLNIKVYQAAIIALTLNAGAYVAEIFRAGIQSIERGQLEAARGLGMSYLQSMRYAIVPQAVRRVIPPLMNEFVILIKDTSLVLVLGLAFNERELMSVGSQGQANTANATFFIMTALGYLAVTLPLIRVVNVLERRLRSGLVGVTGGG
jgi:His/Glu/Gln/Arg/opine family amino acid ABC transporter permease subunit